MSLAGARRLPREARVEARGPPAVVTGVLTPREAFSGFANDIIVVLASIFVLSAALVRTGGLDWLGEALRRVSGRLEDATVGSVMSLSAGLSAFLSNTNVTAVLIPGVEEDAPFAGASLEEAPLGEKGIQVLEIHRGEARLLPSVSTRILPGDLLLVEASRESLLELEETSGLSFPVTGGERTVDLGSGAAKLAEAVVMPRSRLEGETLRGLDFRRRFGISVLALHRRGRGRPLKIGDLRRRVGDVLLLLAPPERLARLQGNRDVWVLGEVSHLARRRRKGWIALAALVGGVVLGSTGLVPLSIALLVTLAASLSFIAPLEPSCLLVYAPGKYRFRDFVRAGSPLSLLVFLILLFLGPVIWPP